MGRHRQRHGIRRGGGGRRGGAAAQQQQDYENEKGQRGSWEIKPKENKAFEDYYKSQGFVPEEEWEEFLESLKQPLPATFRISGNRSEAKEVLRHIEGEYLPKVMDVQLMDETKVIEKPKNLPWYPDKLAWQLNLSRKCIRQNESLKKLHDFLVSETESGHISRQEAVSMIPPLVLDIKPHHKVLDMCAAPGSKTTQLIEYLHADGQKIPEGFVVANDADNKRCYLMVHQVKRLVSPSFLIVNHDATQMPSFRTNAQDDPIKKTVKFDRVLADVPCSGDGTLRKNPDVWGKWNAAGGNNLHHLQYRILRRGLEMLAIGGKLVYSTCSFNPIEDEAVLSSMIQSCEGAVQLVDASADLPGLKYIPGLSSWKVWSRFGDTYEKFEDVPESLSTQIRPSMFPPQPEVAEKLHLNRCMRILPHHQDTGGFFVSVLEKTAELPWLLKRQGKPADKVETEGKVESEDIEKAAEESVETEGGSSQVDTETDGKTEQGQEEGDEEGESDDRPGGKRKKWSERSGSPPPYKRVKYHGYKEDPFIFLDSDDSLWPPIKKFFNLSEFPVNQLMVRCNEGKRRHIYFTAPAVRNLVKCNEDRIRFINMGLKILSRSESKYTDCDYRLVQEGLEMLIPHVSERVIEITKEDIITILSQENPYLSRVSRTAAQQMEELGAQGSVIFVYRPENDDRPDSPKCEIHICGWLGRTSCRSFLAKNDRAHFLRMCGFEILSKEEIAAEKAAKKAAKDGENVENGDSGAHDDDVMKDNAELSKMDTKGEEDIVENTEEGNKASKDTDCKGNDNSSQDRLSGEAAVESVILEGENENKKEGAVEEETESCEKMSEEKTENESKG